jgi:paraquat-inducible protein B
VTDDVNHQPEDIPKAIVTQKKSFSLVWLIPIIAVAIGAWLSFKALMEKGPTVTIVFSSAEGLVAGKTKIRHKSVEIGQVEEIQFGKDLSHVVVTATLTPEMRKYLTDSTQFWVVRARLSGGKVSGLGTLLSGAYIGMMPGEPGEKKRDFTGLDKPPATEIHTPGTHYQLEASGLSSIDIGTPVYYRQLKVGEITEYELDETGDSVRMDVFIRAPYDRHIYKETRFWNVSGINVEVGSDGLEVNTESLTSILFGGIAFGVPDDMPSRSEVEKGETFYLYNSKKKAYAKKYTKKEYYLVYFNGSVRGLTVGSPVTLLGMETGRVVDLKLEYDLRDSSFKIPVLIEMESERLSIIGQGDDVAQPSLQDLVDRGLRAQLQPGNLLTGQLLVEFDVYKDAEPAEVVYQDGVPVMPTIPTSLDVLKSSLQALLKKVEKMPLLEIGENLNASLEGINKLVNSGDINRILDNLEQASMQLNATLKKAENVASGFDETSPAYKDIQRTLNELSAATRSLRLMMEYLERHPEALIKGKSR